jgi:hypothetical protein
MKDIVDARCRRSSTQSWSLTCLGRGGFQALSPLVRGKAKPARVPSPWRPAPCAETQTATTLEVLCELHSCALALSEVSSLPGFRLPLDGVERCLPRAGPQLAISNRTNPSSRTRSSAHIALTTHCRCWSLITLSPRWLAFRSHRAGGSIRLSTFNLHPHA